MSSSPTASTVVTELITAKRNRDLMQSMIDSSEFASMSFDKKLEMMGRLAIFENRVTLLEIKTKSLYTIDNNNNSDSSINSSVASTPRLSGTNIQQILIAPTRTKSFQTTSSITLFPATPALTMSLLPPLSEQDHDPSMYVRTSINMQLNYLFACIIMCFSFLNSCYC